MTVLSIFSFRGRMRRTSYGLFTLAAMAISVVASLVMVVGLLVVVTGQMPPEATAELRAAPAADALLKTPLRVLLPFLVVYATMLAVLYVAAIACAVRRLHDMNVTGWAVLLLVLVFALPWILANAGGWYVDAVTLLAGLVLVFWPTSPGAERFGPDPRVS